MPNPHRTVVVHEGITYIVVLEFTIVNGDTINPQVVVKDVLRVAPFNLNLRIREK